MKDLIGKTINKIWISSDDTILVFDTDSGLIGYETQGDCCSSSWFESITGVEALLGQTVQTETQIDMPEPKEREYKNDHYCEALQDYGEKLTTQKGYIDIVYRNSSNGFFGGWINLMSSIPDIQDFKEITDDWIAA